MVISTPEYVTCPMAVGGYNAPSEVSSTNKTAYSNISLIIY